MAESLVSFVVGKLWDLIVKEAEHLGGVRGQVEHMHNELKNIRCYLRDADSKRNERNESVQNWLNELRDVAHRIEDATDTFYLELNDNHSQKLDDNHPQLQDNSLDDNHGQKNCCCLNLRKNVGRKAVNVGRKAVNVPALHNLGNKLGDIQKQLDEIFKTKERYGIKPLQDESRVEPPVILPGRRYADQDVDETEIVGLYYDEKCILHLLLNEEIHRRAVVTIVGAGGIGKTTLARLVYQSAKYHFDLHAMVPVSEQFELAKVLETMICKLKGAKPENANIVDLMKKELKEMLRKRRYLIVLDDVWKDDVWEQLKDHLPNDNNRSRVLMTSRSIDVAKSADPKMHPYKLYFLNEEDSKNLLLKKALPYREPAEECPSDLLADALSKKCKGLPLALIVLGSILSTKPRTFVAWQRVLDTMDWHQEGIDCMKVLQMSYEDMPHYLKPCFLYLAAFPKDYEISAKCLIRMWVAEGFISSEGTKTMEEVAENCLEQLFKRSLVHVSSRSSRGLIKRCRVHDLVRDLAMSLAKMEIFVTVTPETQGDNYPNRITRRASFQSCNPQSMEYVGANTRSFFWFDLDIINLTNYSGFRLLRVVLFEGIDASDITELKGLDRLIHLKYLGIRVCDQLELPNDCSFDRLKNLETLDLSGTEMVYPPKGLWKIGTLRHVLSPITKTWDLPSSGDLGNLQTLQWVQVMETLDKNRLPCLKNLQKLGLRNQYTHTWDVLLNLFGTLSFLTSLTVSGQLIPMEIVYSRALPYYQNLQTLYLDGEWSDGATIDGSLFPPHLVKLTLVDSGLLQDPMPELAKLNSLKKLRLQGKIYYGTEMICLAGFSQLECLALYLDRLSLINGVMVFKVSEGAMPKLKDLRADSYTMLEMPPYLEFYCHNSAG